MIRSFVLLFLVGCRQPSPPPLSTVWYDLDDGISCRSAMIDGFSCVVCVRDHSGSPSVSCSSEQACNVNNITGSDYSVVEN